MENNNISKIKNYLLENIVILEEIVRDLNSWDGCFEHLDYQHNDDDFFDTFFHDKPMEAVRAVHFGEYNYNDEYVKFNGYGNLESATSYDFHQELRDHIDDIVDHLIDNSHNIYIPDELEDLINP